MSNALLFEIAARVLKRPLAIHEDKLALILAVIEGRLPIESSQIKQALTGGGELTPDAQRVIQGPAEGSSFYGSSEVQDPSGRQTERLPYRLHGSAAIIQVMGSLVNRGAWLGASSGLTSYEGLQFQLRHAAAHRSVETIVLDIASAGGEVTGMFETADLIMEVGKRKKIIAAVNGMAASAAYALASAASRIVLTQSSMVGSIGVVMLHADFSRKLETEGITPTLIFAGKHKVDGNPYQPLSPEVSAKLQAEVDRAYDFLVATVSKGRKLTQAAVRSTEAQMFTGAEATAIGLADEIGSFEGSIAKLAASQSRTGTPRRRVEGLQTAAAGKTAVSQQGAALAPPLVAQAPSPAPAASAALASGADLNTEAGRARATAILNCAGAIRNPELAWQMISQAGLPADLVITALNNQPPPNGGRDPQLGLLILPTHH
jgi:signal peptide peptidase SppA